MIIGIGVDIVSVHRIETLLNQRKEAFLNKVFTPEEQRLGAALALPLQPAFYAKRYAVKEAVSKALGTGIGAQAGWRDIETLRLPSGAPIVRLSGKAAETAQVLAASKTYRIHVSLTDDAVAQAFIILETI